MRTLINSQVAFASANSVSYEPKITEIIGELKKKKTFFVPTIHQQQFCVQTYAVSMKGGVTLKIATDMKAELRIFQEVPACPWEGKASTHLDFAALASEVSHSSLIK